MSVRERKKQAGGDADASDKAIEEGLKRFDRSFEERHYERSKRIRRLIWRWMYLNVGRLFNDQQSMAGEAGNYAKCSSVTAGRWLHQFSQSNMDFYIHEDTSGYVIWLRKEALKEG